MCYPVETFNVCYYYIPKVMRNWVVKTEEEKDFYYSNLGKVMVEIKKKQVEEGKMMIGYAKTKEYKYAFMRMVCTNPTNTPEELFWELEHIERYGEEAAVELGITE